MAGTVRIELGALNIVASPHPEGVYRDALRAIADKEVVLWGSDMGKITMFQPLEDRPNLLFGRVLIWAEIDTQGKWLNKKRNVEATPAEKRAVEEALPPDLEPNFRSFYYLFVEERHGLVIETRNENGQHFAPSRAERMFQRLFEQHLPQDFVADIDVTAIPEDDTLEKIFEIPRLRRLEIYVKRPNADELSEDAARILRNLERQGARDQKLELTKAPKKKSLTPDKDTKTLAAVASTNGYVTGEGKDGTGKPISESTAEHPKVRSLDVEGPTSLGTFLAGVRHFFTVARPR